MSTHNICFYEEISKIITKLSSNIIKYAPYFFCCFFITEDQIRGVLKDRLEEDLCQCPMKSWKQF